MVEQLFTARGEERDTGKELREESKLVLTGFLSFPYQKTRKGTETKGETKTQPE
jgi:hypothetical protein